MCFLVLHILYHTCIQSVTNLLRFTMDRYRYELCKRNAYDGYYTRHDCYTTPRTLVGLLEWLYYSEDKCLVSCINASHPSHDAGEWRDSPLMDYADHTQTQPHSSLYVCTILGNRWLWSVHTILMRALIVHFLSEDCDTICFHESSSPNREFETAANV